MSVTDGPVKPDVWPNLKSFSSARSMRDTLRKAGKAAAFDVAVLISGPLGSGKKTLAHAIHNESKRKDKPFITLTCATLHPDRIQNIFSVFYEADGGTLLLAEIAELTPALQGKLLRILQTGEIYPRSDSSVEIDVRIMSTTRRSMNELLDSGQFSYDLYDKVGGIFPIQVAPLVKRPEDIPGLAERFIKQIAEHEKKDIHGFEEGALDQIKGYAWPGNIREFYNLVYGAVVVANGTHIKAEHMFEAGLNLRNIRARIDMLHIALKDANGKFLNLEALDREVRRQAVQAALIEARGNVTAATKLLGVSRPTLYDFIKKYGLSAKVFG